MAQAVDADQKEEKQQDASAETSWTDFSGSWKLETNNNLDAFLKSQGVGFAKRKIAAVASVTLKLDHKGDSLKIETQTPIKNMNQELKLDGKDTEMENPMTGDKVKFNLTWKDDTKTVIVIKSNNLTTKRIVTTERSIPSQNQMIDEMVNDKGAKMSRVFKRIE